MNHGKVALADPSEFLKLTDISAANDKYSSLFSTSPELPFSNVNKQGLGSVSKYNLRSVVTSFGRFQKTLIFYSKTLLFHFPAEKSSLLF